MRTRVFVAGLAAALVTTLAADWARALQTTRTPAPRESRIPVEKVSLYCREIGQGQPLIVLHRAPDFDHSYLLPALDRLADAFRLIYYDQPGPGQSAEHMLPSENTHPPKIHDLHSANTPLPTTTP